MIDKIQIIHGDFKDSLFGMPDESVGRLLKGLIAFADDEDPKEFLADDVRASTVFPILCQHILRNEEYRSKRANNGRQGGAPIGNGNARQTTKNNQKQPKTTKNNQKQAPNLTLPNLTIPINKKTYGECANVFLTDEEYSKVKDKGLTDLIEELSLYIASKGDKYKNHYAVICQWANRRKKEGQVNSMSGTNARNQFNRFEQRSDYDFAELERKLIKN